MEAFASLYPPLAKRTPIPALYQPFTFALALTPFFFRSRRATALLTLPFIFAFCLCAPFYTFGNKSADYYSTSFFIALPIWFVEFTILTPQDGPDELVYFGNQTKTKEEKGEGQRWRDLRSCRDRLFWAFSLMVPSHRGIGWNWQIKNVHFDPNHNLQKWAYVKRHLMISVRAYVCSVFMLILLGWSSTTQERLSSNHSFSFWIANSLIGWSGATWVWFRLCCFYSFMAALSVAFGVCEIWQWPPIMGNLWDAWSVRQMWSVVYHQTMRKMVSQPALRITRLLGLPKGSLTSRYSQVYLSFFFSCVVHQFQMFNVTRKDMGEFMFFMSQPVAIMLEDFVQWLSRQRQRPLENPETQSINRKRVIGYVWVIFWFSISLPIYVKGCKDARILRDAIFGDRPFEIGARAASIIHG